MKHFRLLFLTVVLSAVCATASAQRVTLDMQNAKLEKVLGQITQQTGLVFNYTRPTINPDKRVSVSVKQAELESVLRQLFDADGIVYEIKDGKVYLADRKGGVNPPPALSAARQRYAGRIVDAAGNPVVGASVVIRGSTTGVSSDIDGRFAIEAREGEVLSVSFVGYTPQTITLGAKTMLTLTLREDTSELEEVVVVGYGTQKKVNVTGSVATIDSKAFDKRPIVSTSAALQGMAPGVTVTTQSGAPGDDGGAIRIRGINSFGGSSTSPLVLIDGIEGSLDSVDPNLIESISILKDAASSSIYGSRAANGVILVTTKRGSKERFSITYKGYVGWQSPTDLPDMVNALEFRELTRAMYLNDGVDLNGEKPGSTPIPDYNDEDMALYRKNLSLIHI